jgi:biotin carboxyl carrier protein
MCDLASEFLSNQRIRSFAQQQAMWQQLEGFIRAVHQGLETKQTVYTIANEGRRLTDADRVSVALGAGRRCRVETVSGLDSIERRADQVKKLGGLAAAVIQAGEPLWYDGDDTNLPPQIERRLHEYIDKSHCKMLAIIPLQESRVTPDEDQLSRSNKRSAKPIGAIIIEQLKDSRISPALQHRAEIVVAHAQSALTNALEHNSVFLMPVWKVLGRATSMFRGQKLVRTALVVACVAGAAMFLSAFPYEFGLGAKGSLVPETQHEVFAQVDGVLQEVFVSDTGETFVQKGQPLALMTNNDLLVEIENLQGQIAEAQQKRNTNKILQTKRNDPADRQLIEGEIRTLDQVIVSLTNELTLKQEEQKLLRVVSPSAGQVVNWQVRQNLLRRPVLRGQNLMTIVDPETRWQIELEMPERRLAHLLTAMNQEQEPLMVTFGLVSHPGSEYEGRVLTIDRQLDVHSDEGNTALVRVGFANDDINPDLLRSGPRVTAKIQCGERSIGYVMFHELIETVQSSVLLWL